MVAWDFGYGYDLLDLSYLRSITTSARIIAVGRRDSGLVGNIRKSRSTQYERGERWGRACGINVAARNIRVAWVVV